MTVARMTVAPLRHPDRLFIDGDWVSPASSASFDVIDSSSEEVFFSVAQAGSADVDRAVTAARVAMDAGPWPRMTHAERADHLRALAAELRRHEDLLAEIWARETGTPYSFARARGGGAISFLDYYAGLADTYPWEEEAPTPGGFGLVLREPVGVVGAIIPWNSPMLTSLMKLAPALIAGCTTILKAAPEAPGAPYVLAEAARVVGLPAGVLNVVTADREVSELLVRDPRVDKISFTGSTAAGRRIGAIVGERVGRLTLELGGKSAAVILDDADLGRAAESLASSGCTNAGQVCAALTRIVITESRHDEFVDALASSFSQVKVGNAFDEQTQMGPLVSSQQRARVEGYIAIAKGEGAILATGGGRPHDLPRGYFVEPTIFADVDNSSRLAQEEVFGPVLAVIKARDEEDAINIANDSIYGLNAAVFTDDVDRARRVAGQLRSGTVGHNGSRVSVTISFGGFKQSGIGREGGREGLLPYLETKAVILDDRPSSWA